MTAIWDSAGINAIRFVYRTRTSRRRSPISWDASLRLRPSPRAAAPPRIPKSPVYNWRQVRRQASESLAKAISYTYNDADDAADSQLMSETDVGGRVWSDLIPP